MSIVQYIFSGNKIFSGSDTGKRGTVAGMSTTASQLAASVKLYEARRHSAADGACLYGHRLDILHWKVSIGTTIVYSTFVPRPSI